jgi:hypothetical protein
MAKETKSKKKPDRKSPAAPAASGAAPMVDPSQSAAAAAALIGRKVTLPASAAGQTESTGFRNLKDSLSKPHSQTIGNVLDKLTPSNQKRSALPFAGPKQLGHNQTFGADVSRRNVPRRTNG